MAGAGEESNACPWSIFVRKLSLCTNGSPIGSDLRPSIYRIVLFCPFLGRMPGVELGTWRKQKKVVQFVSTFVSRFCLSLFVLLGLFWFFFT